MNIGRTVNFFYSKKDGEMYNNGCQIAPAVVNRAWSSVTLNVTVSPDGTPAASKTSVSRATSLSSAAQGNAWATHEDVKAWGVDTARADVDEQIFAILNPSVPQAATE